MYFIVDVYNTGTEHAPKPHFMRAIHVIHL